MPMLDSAECDRSSPASLDEREGSAIDRAKRRCPVERLNGEKDAEGCREAVSFLVRRNTRIK